MNVRLLSSFIVVFLFISVVQGSAQIITTVAGCGIGDDSLGTKAEVVTPMKAISDNAGNTYIADAGDNVIRRIDPSGTITTYAGTGQNGNTGDGGPASAATFTYMYSIVFDNSGNILVADASACVVRLINTTTGIISTVAGNGTAGFLGDGGPATDAELDGPSDVVVDAAGNIFIVDRGNYVVRKVTPSGVISTYAGNAAGSGVPPSFGVPATASSLDIPFRIAIAKNGDLLVGIYPDIYIVRINSAGTISNLAGTGSSGLSGDGGPATAATFSVPCGLAVDSSGNIYFSDIDAGRIRRIDTHGIITTVVGTTSGYGGDGGPASGALINDPEGLSFDLAQNMYVADLSNNRIREISHGGTITTIAGQNGLFSEGYPAIDAELAFPHDVATDAAGNVYISDRFNERVRKLSVSDGSLSTVTGTGISGSSIAFSGDGGPASAAHIFKASALTVDAANNIYFCDEDNYRVRKVDASGNISTIAGNGTFGFAGNGTPALSAEFTYLTGIAVDGAGNVFVCDENNQCIRKISNAGIITTAAGSGVAGYNGDEQSATLAKLNYPASVAVDATGNLYIGDQGNCRIRMVDTTGTIHTIAGDGTPSFGGDGGPAVNAHLFFPLGIQLDSYGNLFIADAGNNRIRMVAPDGGIATIAGNGIYGFGGDGGLASSAMLAGPSGVAVDHSGNLFIADFYNQRIRKVSLAGLGVAHLQHGASGLHIYPNPTTGIVTIENGAGGVATVNDIAGRRQLVMALQSSKETIDLTPFASGLYILQVTDKNGKTTTTKITQE